MNKILEILHKNCPETDFETSTDFIEDELLDSFDVMSIVCDLEEEYGIEIDGADILPESFCSVEQIEELVRSSGGTID